MQELGLREQVNFVGRNMIQKKCSQKWQSDQGKEESKEAYQQRRWKFDVFFIVGKGGASSLRIFVEDNKLDIKPTSAGQYRGNDERKYTPKYVAQ